MITYPLPEDDDVTEEQYLVSEPQAEYKSEFRNGRRVVMQGASRAHSLITVNLLRELAIQLKGKPCEVHTSDMRVRVAKAHLYTYPDVTIVCGEPQFDARDKYSLINPAAIVEVLSPKTQKYDRTEKFSHFQQLESLQEYILVSQDKIHVECRRLEASDWVTRYLTSRDEILEIRVAGCSFSLLEIYDKVELK